MKKRLILVALIILIAGYLGLNYGMDYLQTQAYARSDETAGSVDMSLVSVNTGFGLALFTELCNESPGENIFISPMSISAALSMTYAGAGGTTLDAMAGVLGYTGLDMGQVGEGFGALMSSLEGVDNEITISIANSAWIRDTFDQYINEEYKESLSSDYGSEMFISPFDDETVNVMNTWVSDNTAKKIPKMVENINPNDVLFLINAIYFKADWTNQFKTSDTTLRDFHLADGDMVSVDTMKQDESFMYVKADDYAVLRLPYGRGKVAMYVFLPDADVTVDNIVSDLTPDELEESISLMRKKLVILRLPKFKMTYGVKSLNNALTHLGMGIAFDEALADFSGITDVGPLNLYISKVDHKALIEVDEKGTEAAAVTTVTTTISSMPEKLPFYVNRPFFYVIRDDRSGAILFMGKIENPLIEETG